MNALCVNDEAILHIWLHCSIIRIVDLAWITSWGPMTCWLQKFNISCVSWIPPNMDPASTFRPGVRSKAWLYMSKLGVHYVHVLLLEGYVLDAFSGLSENTAGQSLSTGSAYFSVLFRYIFNVHLSKKPSSQGLPCTCVFCQNATSSRRLLFVSVCSLRKWNRDQIVPTISHWC